MKQRNNQCYILLNIRWMAYFSEPYDKWRDIECNGEPTMDDLDDYRMCKLLKMFEKEAAEGKETP